MSAMPFGPRSVRVRTLIEVANQAGQLLDWVRAQIDAEEQKEQTTKVTGPPTGYIIYGQPEEYEGQPVIRVLERDTRDPSDVLLRANLIVNKDLTMGPKTSEATPPLDFETVIAEVRDLARPYAEAARESLGHLLGGRR